MLEKWHFFSIGLTYGEVIKKGKKTVLYARLFCVFKGENAPVRIRSGGLFFLDLL